MRRRPAASTTGTAGALLLAALLLAGCPREREAPKPPPPAPRVPGVRLLLLVVVDQLAWDTLERARPALSGSKSIGRESSLSRVMRPLSGRMRRD